ncbi:MAG TPA: hypothetical protein DCR43_06165 [Bacteroidales bacterium]|nr:MAG: hypothetical protein A2X11_08635 [Bacteroidetes bacterium GWE2_42_24]OFY31850.1 MAG: hypothetical protein A2X09_09730 [Bacteroidetes bacterium GWF2_43_11]HAQ65419.1 hypothetical protein [Bacteroidales bacterium]HBZ66488.1 hypothetical protein [Bacteroidales bacterium]
MKYAASNYSVLIAFFYYFIILPRDGTIEFIPEFIRDLTRKIAGMDESPKVACIENQFVKTTRMPDSSLPTLAAIPCQ